MSTTILGLVLFQITEERKHCLQRRDGVLILCRVHDEGYAVAAKACVAGQTDVASLMSESTDAWTHTQTNAHLSLTSCRQLSALCMHTCAATDNHIGINKCTHRHTKNHTRVQACLPFFWTHIAKHANMYACMHSHNHAHTYTLTHKYMHACTHTHTHMHARTHAHTLTHTHT